MGDERGVDYKLFWIKDDMDEKLRVKHCFSLSALNLSLLDMFLLRSYTRFSCSLIKWNLQRAKITIPPLNTFYTNPLPPTRRTKWPINEFHVSQLNWRQFLHCYNIDVYSTSVLLPSFLLVTGIGKKKFNKSLLSSLICLYTSIIRIKSTFEGYFLFIHKIFPLLFFWNFII